MRYLKTFESHNNYEDFTETEAFVKPNVSYCIQLNEVHYNPIETRLIIKYNVIDTSEPTKLYEYYIGKESMTSVTGAIMFDKIEIDDVDVPIADIDETQGTYQFATTGEHIVKYTLKDPTFIGTKYDEQTDTTEIGALFYGCEAATAIEIPNSMITIGDYAFDTCTSLTSIIIPNSVTDIGEGAFSHCYSLTSVTIGNSVISIGDNIFEGCGSLTSIIVESGNTTYDSRNNCNAIIETTSNTLVVGCKNTVIPNSVTNIGDYAFFYCSGLTSVTIPNSVTSIGYNAFEGCTDLTSLTIGNSVTTIGEWAFANCSSLSSVVIPNSVTSIGEEAFQACIGLTSVTISNSITSIGINVFRNCTGLTSVIIPNSVTSIAGYAFYRCTGLTSVTIGNSVTSISNSAFASCSGLTNIISLATTAPTIQNDTFRDVKTNGTLTVPSGSSGYNAWMVTGNYYLGKYSWTKVEQ